MNSLLAADQWLFECINSGLGNPLLDFIMPFVREKWFWAPLYLYVVAFVFTRLGQRGWLLIAGLVLSVGLSDFTSSTLIKKNVQRLRPCNDPLMAARVQERVGCGAGYSFCSSHAANHFAVAVFLCGVFGLSGSRAEKWWYAWAAFIAFAQVYVGVHYPADILAGALLGFLIGKAVLSIWKRFFPEVITPVNRQYP